MPTRWARSEVGSPIPRRSARSRLLYRDTANAWFRVIDAADTRRRQVLITPFQFEPGTTRALVVHNDDKGRSALYETDLLTRKDIRTLFVMPEGSAEVDYPVVSTDGTTLLGAATTRADERIVLDRSRPCGPCRRNSTRRSLGRGPHRELQPGSQARCWSEVAAPAMPGFLYYYDVDDGVLHKITELHAGLGRLEALSGHAGPLSQAVMGWTSRDVAFLRGVDPKQLPFIVLPHGGPWAQE